MFEPSLVHSVSDPSITYSFGFVQGKTQRNARTACPESRPETVLFSLLCELIEGKKHQEIRDDFGASPTKTGMILRIFVCVFANTFMQFS